MKAGELYSKIAEVYAAPIANGPKLLDQRGAVGIFIKAGDYLRVERIVKLEEVIKSGISALRNALDYEMRQYLPIGYDEYVLHDTKCEALQLNLLGVERQQAIITVIMSVMEAIHDAWVKERLRGLADDHGSLSQACMMDDGFRRLFVPFPLLEWKIIRRYLEMTKILLNGCSPLPEEATVRACCERRTREFCQMNGICDERTLQEKLMEGAKFYPAIDGPIGEKLARQQNSQRAARTIMADIGRVVR